MASKDGPEQKASQQQSRGSKKKYIFFIIIVLIAFGIPWLNQFLSGGVCLSKARMDGKTVIVTGANTGIGKETVQDIIGRGARVVMACRNQQKCQKAADDITKATGKKPVVKILDLADFESIRTFAKEINKEESRLDVLINNAAVMMCPMQLTKQGYELQFGTNHLGHFLLTHLLLDLLKKSAPSRIVVVSSVAQEYIGRMEFDNINAEKEYSTWKAYCQSKLANVHFSNELARRLKGTGVVVNSLHPGAVNTDVQRHAQDMIPGPIMSLLAFLKVKETFFKTPLQGAQTQICLAVSEELEGVTGKYFSDCEERELKPHAKNEEDARRLWTISEQMTGLKT